MPASAVRSHGTTTTCICGRRECDGVLKEIRFSYRHEGCWLQEATEAHPDLLLVVSSVYSANEHVVMTLTVHASDPETLPVVEAAWQEDPRIDTLQRLHDGPRGVRFHVTYSSPHSIFHHIVEHTPVSIGVIRVAGGAEHYQLVGETQAIQDIIKILASKGELEVESIRTPGEVEPKAGVWDQLTDKQVEALVLAQAAGYYRWPRDKSASALAQDLGLSSSAFLDQLRHAEGRLITGLVDRLREQEPGRVEAIRARMRRELATSA